jgi:hypothetical protein
MNISSRVFILICGLLLAASAFSAGCQQGQSATQPVTTDERLTVLPCTDDPEGYIRFENVTLQTSTLPEGNYSPLRHVPNQPGDPCFIINGRIVSSSANRCWVAYHAYGYDDNGKEVSFTLDTRGPIVGVEQRGIDPHSTEDFTLHLSWSENTTSFTLYSQKSDVMFP